MRRCSYEEIDFDFLIFSILIVSLTGCNVSPQNNVQTNSSALAAYRESMNFYSIA